MSLKWRPIVAEASRIARSYATSVTLRQLHYRLVSANLGYLNTQACYKRLSSLTAEERRLGIFPPLSDLTRGVNRPRSFADPGDALDWLAQVYRRNRTEGQEYQVWVLYEKATLTAQMQAWTREYGIPVAALRGYSSESLEREIFDAMADDGRDAIVFYVGDLDPEGEDIERNFVAQALRQRISFKAWTRLAVLPEQVTALGLVPNFGKPGSSRAPGFVAKYGRLFQVEAEAVDPADLEQMVTDAIRDPVLFDERRWRRSRAKEQRDITALQRLRRQAE